MMQARLRFQELSPTMGADVVGLDLAAVVAAGGGEVMSSLRDALDRSLLLRFRRQRLEPAELVGFARLFGPVRALKRAVNADARHIPGYPDIKVVTNAVREGRPLGDGDANGQAWHTDGTYQDPPTALTLLYALVVPAQPPKTHWLSTRSVYAGLPEALKAEIAGLSAEHQSPYSPPAAGTAPIIHPLVTAAAPGGEPSLYLPNFDSPNAPVVGLEQAAGAALLARLRAQVNATPAALGLALEPDDLVVWDNRWTAHRRDGWNAAEERTLWHVTVDSDSAPRAAASWV